MPSRAPASARTKRRRRRRVSPNALLALALVANVVAGALWSPLTAVRSVRVEGAQADDQDRLRELAQRLHEVPWARISAPGFESAVLERDDLEDASLESNPFGRALLRVRARVPVAVLSAPLGYFLAADGKVARGIPDAALPRIAAPPDAVEAGAALVGRWAWRTVADLARSLPPELDPGTCELRLDAAGMLSLKAASGTRILLGSADRLDEKMKVLQAALAHDRGLLGRAAEVNLVAPDMPVYVPK